MVPNSSVAKPYLKKLARFVLYYIHFTLLAAMPSLPLLTAATALSLGC